MGSEGFNLPALSFSHLSRMTLSESLKQDLQVIEIALQKCDSILNKKSEDQETQEWLENWSRCRLIENRLLRGPFFLPTDGPESRLRNRHNLGPVHPKRDIS